MELRSCSDTHFIQAIKGGLVIKVLNTDSHGRPALSYKTLKDVYEGKDAKRLQQPPTINSHNMRAGSAFDHERVKSEIPCLPVVDKSLQDVKPEANEFVPCADDGLDSDLDDDTTLIQLKKRFLTKKRKFCRSGEISNQAFADEKPLKDDNEPLINWMSKKSRYFKAKRKCMNENIVSPLTIAFAIKSEHDLVSEVSAQVGGDLASVVRVKVEVPEAEELGCQSKVSFADNSSIGHNEVPSHGEASNGLWVVQREHIGPLMSSNCVTNEMSYDHLEDAVPISMLVPSDDMSIETVELGCNKVTDLTPMSIQLGKEIRYAYSCRSSPSDNEYSDVCMLSKSSAIMEEISKQSSDSGLRVADMDLENTIGCMRLHHEVDIVLFEDKAKEDLPCEHENCTSSPDDNCSSSQYSNTSLKTDDILVSTEDAIADEQPLTCSSDDITNIGLNCGSNMEDEFLKTEKQSSGSPIAAAESCFSLKNQIFGSADRVSTPEKHQPPERLPSTRKAISPSSQEQLCLAVNSVELCNEFDQFKCQEKLFEKQTGEKSSPVKSDIQHAKITVDGGHGKVSQRKVIISPRHIIEKSQETNGNLKGPRFSGTVPKLNTGCTSIKRCSKSAIAFSQRQMHDMESVAVKLMNELKSMTDIVEQKLLFETYRNVSLKNDADKVKSAIHSAKKMEKMTRKWLSVMAKDCNRYCKIMKLTPNGVPASKDAVPGKRRKIVFADEAGGKLCHIKFFENGATPPASDDVKQ